MMVFAALAIVLVAVVLFEVLRHHLATGGKVPIGGGMYVRRHAFGSRATRNLVFGRNVATPANSRSLIAALRELCVRCLDGETLPYPYLINADGTLANRHCLFVFEGKTDRLVAANVSFEAGYPDDLVVHTGLVLVDPDFRGRGLQTLTVLNLVCLCFDYTRLKYIITDISDSPSNCRNFDKFGLDVYPSVNTVGEKAKPWHLDVARYMLANHRADFCCSVNAKFDDKTFVVKGSNDPNGGGADVLTRYVATRRSRTGRLNEWIDSLLDHANGDELFQVCRGDLLHAAGVVMRDVLFPRKRAKNV